LVGTVWEGYSLRKPLTRDISDVAKVAREAFPVKDADLNRELVRFLAVVQDGEHDLIPKVTAHFGKLADPVERVHYLTALGRLGGNRTADDTRRVAEELVTLDAEYRSAHILRDRHWPLRLTEVATALCEKDPRLLPAVLAHPDFGHAEHLWLAKLPGVDRVTAAKAFVKQAGQMREYPWSAGHVEFVAELPEADRRPLLLKLADRGFADSVAVQLAKQPIEADRGRFVAGLSSASAGVVSACAKALAKLPTQDTAELVPLVRSIRRFADPKADAAVRKEVFALLQLRTGERFDDVAKWEAWLREKHAELAKGLSGVGYDAAAWKKRLAEVNWEKGDAANGKAVFGKAQCAACHNGGNAVGPSLAGVSKRFSRDDLLTTILEPSRDISPRYRTTKFTTTDDKVYEGVIIYEATDGVILQTGADSTVRLAGKAIDSKTPGTLSLMPTGLMDALSAAEIADLFAYLKGLEK
jgi:putative heme-binding domain-containing protein